MDTNYVYNENMYEQLTSQNNIMYNNFHSSFDRFYLRSFNFFALVFGAILALGILYYLVVMLLKYCNCDNDCLDVKNKKDTRAWLLLTTPLIAYIGFNSLINYGYNLGFQNCANIASFPASEAFVPFGLFTAYVWYDLFFNNLPFIFVFHHIIAGFVPVIMYLLNDRIGIYFTLIVMISEISTVFLNIVYLTNGWFRSFFKLVFTFTFIVFRPILYTSILFNVINCNEYFTTSFGYFVAFFSISFLWIINLYWLMIIPCKMCCSHKKD